MMAEESKPNSSVEPSFVPHVQVKIPPFMEMAVTGWFTIIEAQFSLGRITVQATKFYHAISAMPGEVVARLTPQVLNSKDYDVLKEAVLSLYEKTKPEMFDKLMESHSISGRPSLYLNEMLSLAERLGVDDSMIRHKFLKALPQTVSPVLATQSSLTLTQLGHLADEMMPYFASNVMAVNTERNDDRFSNGSNNDWKNKGNNNIPMSVRPYVRNQRTKVCRAHLYFGEKARNCKPWCQWPEKKGCKILPNSRPSSPARRSSQEN